MTDERMPGWDDVRLEAAFRGLAAAAPPPPGLATATVAAVREAAARPRRLAMRPALFGLAGVAAAAVIVVAVAAWPRATTVPVGSAVQVADLQVIDVPTLQERMEEPQPEEVIVRGWFAVAPVEVDCEVVERPHPLIPDCEEWYRFLMAEPETLGGERGGPIEPVGAHVVPMLRVDSHIGIASEGETVEVLAVGHLADHRLGTCPDAEQPECSRRFVIDRLLPAGAEIVDLPDPWQAGAPPTSSAEDAVRALAGVIGPASVVSIGSIAASDLPSIEPIAAGDEPIDGRTLWVVRAFVSDEPVARTFILVDGALDTSPVSEITATSVLDMATLNQNASPTESPWPSASRGPSGVPSPSPSTAGAFPVEVAGLPVIDIDAARQVRIRPGDARELAIAGWYEHAPTFDCLPVEDPTLLSRGCPGDIDDPHLLDADGDPGVHLIVATPIERPQLGGNPVPVVVVGHFDDRRAEACPVERRSECQDAFVVDAIWVDGRLGAGAWELATDRSVPAPEVTRDWVSRAIRKAGPGPDAQLLSVGQVRGPDLARIEPAGIGAVLANETWVWHATVLFGDEIWTFLLPDDDLASFVETGTVHGYQIFDGGLQEFTSVDGPTPVPTAEPG
jgi:hypothetical protein